MTPENQTLACVTGATGVVGKRICEQLLLRGYRVMAFSRQARPPQGGVEFFTGDVSDKGTVAAFMRGAEMVFHCAGELNEETHMWATNVRGTENVLQCAEEAGVAYFCHLSSVGVIGKTDAKLVDEQTPCSPQNAYEKSKLAAEQLVMRGIKGCKVVALRPTNVVDVASPGIIALAMRRSLADRFKLIVKGGECSHLVPAEDVGEAAMHFISCPPAAPQAYIVSLDHDPLNTLAGIWAMFNASKMGAQPERIVPAAHLPIAVPYLLRNIYLGRGNRGDVLYSSEKLMRTGFVYSTGLRGIVNKIAAGAQQ